MFRFDNTHIFTGYLKQLLSHVNIPTCRIYTRDFENYRAQYGKEDPRIIESFDTITHSNNSKQRIATRTNYLIGNELYYYFWDHSDDNKTKVDNHFYWKRASTLFYSSDKNIPGLTKTLVSPGNAYDTTTHEYLGDYLRFLRDYHNINLMSLYNCFNNKICSNIYYPHNIKTLNPTFDETKEISTKNQKYRSSITLFDSNDIKYHIYMFPVKLFSDYTIAIDCDRELEMFCGLYTDVLDTSDKGKALIAKTYKKVNRTFFSQPFLFDKLNVRHWNFNDECTLDANGSPSFMDSATVTRWDITSNERDLKLFIKVPVSCKSSIAVLEGDFRRFNDTKYAPVIVQTKQDDNTITERAVWEYKQNRTVINFGDSTDRQAGLDINESPFVPISKVQLLAFNTGESYPFADRLVEYLSNSAITPIDEIADNIKRAQRVMSQNRHYFKIEGLWEDKMQKIIYDYLMNSGPLEINKENNKLVNRRSGLHPSLGHVSRSAMFDVLGYVDKDAEKWYASWKIEKGKTGDNKAVVKVKNIIQNVDIYNGLYDIE